MKKKKDVFFDALFLKVFFRVFLLLFLFVDGVFVGWLLFTPHNNFYGGGVVSSASGTLSSFGGACSFESLCRDEWFASAGVNDSILPKTINFSKEIVVVDRPFSVGGIKISPGAVIFNSPDLGVSSTYGVSMMPAVGTGYHYIFREYRGEHLSPGTIIGFVPEDNSSFIGNPSMVSHRVIGEGVDERGHYYVTKGDNNPSVDPVVRDNFIKVYAVGVIYG